ncbi:unnamed protein product, partial [Laminaria digitata]
MVNTSRYCLRYRQDGHKHMPAGTVGKAGDGQRSIYANDGPCARDSEQSSCFNTPVQGDSYRRPSSPWSGPYRSSPQTMSTSGVGAGASAGAAARDRKSADGGRGEGEARTAEGPTQGGVAEARGGGISARRGSDTLGRGENLGESRPTGSFAGMPGDATPAVGEGGGWSATDPENFLRENLSLKDLVSLAYMFNFSETGVLGLGE